MPAGSRRASSLRAITIPGWIAGWTATIPVVPAAATVLSFIAANLEMNE
jgi:hypothetical protein